MTFICRLPCERRRPGALWRAPTSMYPYYDHDEDHLRLWVSHARSDKGAAEYIEQWVMGCRDHFEYLERVGGYERLQEIKADSLLGY